MAAIKFYHVIPTSGHTMDFSANALWDPVDLTAMKDVQSGRDTGALPSLPTALELSDPPDPSVQVGMTTGIGVKVQTQEPGKYMTGAAVVFKIDTVLSTGTATLLGGDGPPIGDQRYGEYRYDHVGELMPTASDEAAARVTVRVDTAGTIAIKVYTPEVGTSESGRYMPHLEVTPIQITGTP